MSVVGYMGIDLNFNAYPIKDGRSCTVHNNNQGVFSIDPRPEDTNNRSK